MLLITRKFTVGVSRKHCDIIERKFDELNIIGYSKHLYDFEVGDKTSSNYYYVCTAGEEKMNLLIEFLQNEYKGIASIIY